MTTLCPGWVVLCGHMWPTQFSEASGTSSPSWGPGFPGVEPPQRNLSSEGLNGEPAAPAGLTRGRDPIRSRGPSQCSSIYTRARDTRTRLHAEEWEAEGPGAHTVEERVRGLTAQTPWKDRSTSVLPGAWGRRQEHS